jgi:hypothetical protein
MGKRPAMEAYHLIFLEKRRAQDVAGGGRSSRALAPEGASIFVNNRTSVVKFYCNTRASTLDPGTSPVENNIGESEEPMHSKLLKAALISLLCLTLPAFSGCAWENGGNNQGDGYDGQDALDAGIDEGPVYPPGPYGNDFGDTVANFVLQRCLCPGGPASGVDFKLEEYLGAKAILISAHAGDCSVCKVQAAAMENDFYQLYKDRGFKIVLAIISDSSGSDARQDVLDYCCRYKSTNMLTCMVAADPEMGVMRNYIRSGTPLNMLLDDRMVIRYKVEGYDPDSLLQNVVNLLDE